ncbi:MAG: universal stress protein [Flavobacteriales bacterium]|nr:universal stress protein [Flavobacteriales bacterium]MBK8707489.1 universal stress protein [Flavobacteriales bacterium]
MARILLPTDFSEAALNASKFAFDLFGTTGNKFTLVHTFLKPSFDNALLPSLGDFPQREAINRIRRVERKCRKYAGKVVLGRKVSTGSLVDLLNEMDQRKRVDMIVMGTQGEGNYGRVGGNTRSVVTGASAPVITVPAQWQPVQVKRIMLAYDGGHLERTAVKPLLDLAERTGAAIVIAHVRSTKPTDDVKPDRGRIKELFAGVEHSFVSVQGDDVSDTIDQLANEGRIQMVAVIHRQLGFWKGLFHSSKAKRMALHISTPLLVLSQ